LRALLLTEQLSVLTTEVWFDFEVSFLQIRFNLTRRGKSNEEIALLPGV
jgi:hypothetical protein